MPDFWSHICRLLQKLVDLLKLNLPRHSHYILPNLPTSPRNIRIISTYPDAEYQQSETTTFRRWVSILPSLQIWKFANCRCCCLLQEESRWHSPRSTNSVPTLFLFRRRCRHHRPKTLFLQEYFLLLYKRISGAAVFFRLIGLCAIISI